MEAVFYVWGARGHKFKSCYPYSETTEAFDNQLIIKGFCRFGSYFGRFYFFQVNQSV